MVKLLVCDVDGTLLPYGKAALPTDIADALLSAAEKGITLAIASGRAYTDLLELFSPLGSKRDDIYFISHDGALTVHRGKVLFHQAISMDAIRRFVQLYRDCPTLALYSAENCYLLKGNSKFVKGNSTPISNLFDIKEQIYKVAAYDDALTPMQEPTFPITGLRLCSKSPGCIEYVTSLASKGTAVSDLQMRLFMNKLDTAAIGNYLNDVKMLKNAKYSAAMASSPEEVKASALCTVDNAADFIKWCITQAGK